MQRSAVNETQQVVLRLATPRGIACALALLGWTWELTREPTSSPGMYAWTMGGDDPTEIADRGVLYVGDALGAGGVGGRLRDEKRWMAQWPEHEGVGIITSLGRCRAESIGGAVTWSPPDLRWLDEIDDQWDGVSGRAKVEELVASVDAHNPAALTERIAIRVAFHLADVPPPLNTKFASGWEQVVAEPYDHAAWATARCLRERGRVGLADE